MSIQIQINKRYRLTSNKLNFILEKREKVKKGQTAFGKKLKGKWTTYNNEGYYPSLSLLHKALVTREIQSSEVTSLGELVEETRKIQKKLAKELKIVRKKLEK